MAAPREKRARGELSRMQMVRVDYGPPPILVSDTKRPEPGCRVETHLMLVGEPVQVTVLARDESVADREYVCSGNSKCLALGDAAHHVLRNEMLATKMNPS